MPERKDRTGSPKMRVGRPPATKSKELDNMLVVDLKKNENECKVN